MSDFEISGNGKEIATALSHLSATIPSRSTLAVLSCAALRINNGELAASTSNLDAMHTLKLPVAVRAGNDGAGCCAGLSMLSGLLAKFGDAEVMIQAEKGALKVTSGSKTATLQTLPLDQFPEMATTAEEKGKVDGAKLAAAIRSVAFAQSKDETRRILNGIYADGTGELVASDGARLAIVRTDLAVFSGILPTFAVSPIISLLERNHEVTVSDSDSEVLFSSPSETYLSRKIEGNYPNFKQVIPDYRSPDRYVFDRETMQKALSFASVYAGDKLDTVKLSFKDGGLELQIRNINSGEFTDFIPLIESPSTPMVLAVKSEFLAKVLTIGKTDNCHFDIEANGDGSVSCPLVFEDKASNWKALVMPCRPK